MKNIFKLLILCILVFNCNSNDDLLEIKAFCSVDNPTENLAWLKNEIENREQNITEDSKYLYIYQSTHNSEVIIIYADCCPSCNSVYPVYNCKGESLGIIGYREQDIPFDVLSEGQIIWKTTNFECGS